MPEWVQLSQSHRNLIKHTSVQDMCCLICRPQKHAPAPQVYHQDLEAPLYLNPLGYHVDLHGYCTQWNVSETNGCKIRYGFL